MHSRKRLLVGLSIGVGVLAVCGAAAFFIPQFVGHRQTSSTATKSAAADDWRQQAQRLAYSGNLDGAIKLYDDHLKAATTPADRESILITKIQYLLEAKRNDEAYKAAQDAVVNKQDASSYGSLADTQAAKGLTADAIASYKKALSLADQSGRPGRSGGGATYYQRRIQELGG